MPSPCNFTGTCPFFRAFGHNPSPSIRNQVESYCRGTGSACWRLSYISKFGDQPSKYITPTGQTFPALSLLAEQASLGA